MVKSKVTVLIIVLLLATNLGLIVGIFYDKQLKETPVVVEEEIIITKNNILTLEGAYVEEILSQKDIKDIAYYYHEKKLFVEGIGYTNNDYNAAPKNPKELDYEMQCKILNAYKERNSEINYDILELKYYGTYNGCIAFSIEFDVGYIDDTHIKIAGVDFLYGTLLRRVWICRI